MTARSPERSKFLAYILVTALEGDTRHWADVENYETKDFDATGNANSLKATIADNEGQLGRFDIDIETIATGISRITAPTSEMVSADRIKMIAEASAVNDAGDIDGELADAILQAGVFNDVPIG